MKKALYLFLIIVALGLGYLKFLSANTPFPSPSPSLSPTASPTLPPPALQTLSTPYFELSYPAAATISSYTSPDSSTWAIVYMGNTQKESGRTQTELFDGYNISLTYFEVVGENLRVTQAEADRQGIIDACGEESLTSLKNITLGKYEAISFYGGCLGEAYHYYIETETGLYRITKMIVGPEENTPEYTSITSQILDKLTLK